MQDDEIKAFNDALINVENIAIKPAIMVFIMTGFRRGEVAGLTVSKRADHARTSTTTDIYAYALESNDKEDSRFYPKSLCISINNKYIDNELFK